MRNDDNLVDVDEVDVNEVDVDEVDVDEVDVNEVDVDEDRRKLYQICNSLKRLIRDYLGKIQGGSNSWKRREEYQRALPSPIAGWASIGVENYKFTGMIIFALHSPPPPNCVCK